MKASEAQLFGVLKKSPQFIIPIYQRTYSWREKECRQLWHDIVRAGNNDAIPLHFFGSIVYIQEGLSLITHQEPLLVIDGQQRLATVMILLAALAEALGDESEPIEGFSASKLRNYYLLNPSESGERRYKLLLSQTDKETLISIVDKRQLPMSYSLRLKKNFDLFKDLIAEQQGDLTPIYKGVAKLIIVEVALDRDQDNPQLIFESLNSTGRELSQADLVRNFILMELKPEAQTRIYKEFWQPMEIMFGQEAYETDFNEFMRYYLTVKTGEIPRRNDVYEVFKEYARSQKIAEENIETLVNDIYSFAKFYCAMALDQETDSDLKLAFHDLRELKMGVVYPFLLELYKDYIDGLLTKENFLRAIRLIESYLFRRSICTIPTNSLNKTFATFTKSLQKNRYIESIKAHFLLLQSYRRFPDDQEFKRDLQTRNLYNFRNRSYWLRRLENHDKKERVPVDEYTIEHIMPQNKALPNGWKEALGNEWERVHQTYLHTLGNLTLTGYNSEYSDHSFKEKCNMEGGFKHSPLKVNSGLSEWKTWDENSIKSRAEILAEQMVKIWQAPVLSAEILENYKPKENRAIEYSIDNYSNLSDPRIRELFEAFRKEVLGFDPCVSEERRKNYIAYKAETNFVYLNPQVNQLRLNLIISFSDINDPRGICENVLPSQGHNQASREVVVRFREIDKLPYVVGLARQAFETQLGNGDNT